MLQWKALILKGAFIQITSKIFNKNPIVSENAFSSSKSTSEHVYYRSAQNQYGSKNLHEIPRIRESFLLVSIKAAAFEAAFRCPKRAVKIPATFFMATLICLRTGRLLCSALFLLPSSYRKLAICFLWFACGVWGLGVLFIARRYGVFGRLMQFWSTFGFVVYK